MSKSKFIRKKYMQTYNHDTQIVGSDLTRTWVSVACPVFIVNIVTLCPTMEGSNAGPVSVLGAIRTTRVCTLCPVRPHLPYTVNFKLET